MKCAKKIDNDLIGSILVDFSLSSMISVGMKLSDGTDFQDALGNCLNMTKRNYYVAVGDIKMK